MSIDRSLSTAGRAPLGAIVLIVIVAIAAAVFAVVALRNLRARPQLVPPLRLTLAPPDELTVGGGTDYPFGLSLAPDGRRLVFPAARQGATQLWLYDLTTADLQSLPGTVDAVLPFWSPDGRAVGFFAAGKLRVFSFEDGTVRDVADAPAPRGGAWHPAGDIIFAPNGEGGLVRRHANGTLQPYTTLDAAESSHRHPAFLNDGRLVVFFVGSSQAIRQGIWIAPFDDAAGRTRLANSDAQAIPLDAGVLYSSDGALVAQPIDLETRSLRGRPILVGTPVGRGPHNQLFATVGGDVLVFGPPATGMRELRWIDRAGTSLGVVGEPMDAWDVRLAPHGGGVAVARVDPQLKTLDIWSYDGDRPLPRRISPSIDVDEAPAWSRDAATIAWVSARRALTIRGAQAELPDHTLRRFEHPIRVTSWSHDSKWIVVSEARPDSRGDIWLMAANGVGDPTPYAHSAFSETHGVVSPDGMWLAYASDESGQFEIYIDAFPTPRSRGRLTVGGGTEPRWNGDGTELFFRRGTEIHAVRPDFSGAAPEAASTERLFDAGGDIRSYDVASDGKRFLVNLPGENRPSPMRVVVNIRSLLPSAP
jgi:Tol biopolymer transport system component